MIVKGFECEQILVGGLYWGSVHFWIQVPYPNVGKQENKEMNQNKEINQCWLWKKCTSQNKKPSFKKKI